MSIRSLLALAVFAFGAYMHTSDAQQASVPYDPLPRADPRDVIGVWIGHLPENHLFFRLELDRSDARSGGTGYLTTVYSKGRPNLYRVIGWRLVDATHVEIPLKPIDEKAYPMTLSGVAHGGDPDHLFLDVGNGNTLTRNRVVMYRESNYSEISEIARSRITNARREAERP